MFKKILIVNRGEIAVRILRSARELGIKTAVIYSEADKEGLPVILADEAYLVGPASALKSYLNMQKIIEIAKECGAEAVHPGYGFLAENAEFAKACKDNGLTFIGPDVKTMKLMEDKFLARQYVARLGVPILPGILIENITEKKEEILEQCEKMGYPLLLKTNFGGGGKGIRVIRNEEELNTNLELSTKEAKMYFGRPEIYLEKYLERAKHIEVQFLRDKFGNIIVFQERECSLQRRYQKLIEETPAVIVDERLRQKLQEYTTTIVEETDYHGAGTVEFLVDFNGKAYFLEINARLQVEHPVTEMVYRLDLVKEQIKIAAGEQLKNTCLKPIGWAIEARIIAEDWQENFKPSIGKIGELHLPGGPEVRVDTALKTNMEITPYYDSLLAKVIAWGNDREAARLKLLRAVQEMQVTGIKTNLGLIAELLQLSEFLQGEYTTRTVENYLNSLFISKNVQGR